MTNKTNKQNIIIPAAIVLLIIASLVYIIFTQEPNSKPDPASEKIIREAAGKQLNKDPNDLSSIDYKNIEELTIAPDHLRVVDRAMPFGVLEFIESANKNYSYSRISDISLLGKMVNLRKLYINDIIQPVRKPPDWLPQWFNRYFSASKDISLSPLENLKNLQELHIRRTRIRSLKSLTGLQDLKILCLYDCPVKDIKPLLKLTNLQEIRFSGHQVSDEHIKRLKKKMPNVRIIKVGLL